MTGVDEKSNYVLLSLFFNGSISQIFTGDEYDIQLINTCNTVHFATNCLIFVRKIHSPRSVSNRLLLICFNIQFFLKHTNQLLATVIFHYPYFLVAALEQLIRSPCRCYATDTDVI